MGMAPVAGCRDRLGTEALLRNHLSAYGVMRAKGFASASHQITKAMISKFSFPTIIHFGPGTRRMVAEHLREQGVKRPLIVTDKGLAALPILKEFGASLGGLAVHIFPGVYGNPTKKQVVEGVKAFKAHHADA